MDTYRPAQLRRWCSWLALQLGHQRAWAARREPADLTREMRLVGIASLDRQKRQRCVAVREKPQEALEAKNPPQRLGPIAERFMAAPTQGALTPAEFIDQRADEAVRAFLRCGRDSHVYDRIAGCHPMQTVDE